MSISNEVSRVVYTGNGVTTIFPYPFRIIDKTHLKVSKYVAGIETPLIVDTGFTVAGVGVLSGGTVTLVGGALTSGAMLVIRRVPPVTQLTEIRNQGDFYPEAIEDAIDNSVMITQAIKDDADRSLKLPETVSGSDFDTRLPAGIVDNPGSFLLVNDTADGFEIGPVGSDIAAAQSSSVAAVSAAATAVAAANSVNSVANPFHDAGTSGAALSLDLSTSRAQRFLATAADVTLTLTNPFDGQSYLIAIRQDGVGNRNIIWPSNVKWANGAAAPASSSAFKIDVYTLVWRSDLGFYLGTSSMGYYVNSYLSLYSGLFNGTSSYISVGTGLNTNIKATAGTFAAWVKVASLPSFQRLFDSEDPANGYKGAFFGTQGAGLIFQACGGGAGGLLDVRNTTISADINAWTHLCVTWDGTGTAAGVKVYKNAVSIIMTLNTNTLSGTTVSAVPMRIGASPDGGSFLNGKLDEVTFWNVALSAAQVTQLYNAGHGFDLVSHSKYANLVTWLQMGEIPDNPSAAGGVGDRKGTNHGTGTNLTFVMDVP